MPNSLTVDSGLYEAITGGKFTGQTLLSTDETKLLGANPISS